MNRKIEFRGYSYIYKKWFYGSLFIRGYDGEFMLSNDETNIIDEHSNKVTVDSSTVGQYTGLKDKNGKKIFEGDILKRHFISGGENAGNRYIKVVWNEKNCSFNINHITSNNYEVIGNIYENNLESKGE